MSQVWLDSYFSDLLRGACTNYSFFLENIIWGWVSARARVIDLYIYFTISRTCFCNSFKGSNIIFKKLGVTEKHTILSTVPWYQDNDLGSDTSLLYFVRRILFCYVNLCCEKFYSKSTSTAKFLWAAQTKNGTAYKLMKLHANFM